MIKKFLAKVCFALSLFFRQKILKYLKNLSRNISPQKYQNQNPVLIQSTPEFKDSDVNRDANLDLFSFLFVI